MPSVASWYTSCPLSSPLYEIHALWPQARQLRCKLRVAIDALVAEIPALLNADDDAVAKTTIQSVLGKGCAFPLGNL
jgi:hypothetical protein